MGWISIRTTTTSRSKNLTPAVRAYTEASGKRFQCDLFGFWRKCGRAGCRRRHGCAGGDPYDCFKRHQAAMPRNHKNWRCAELLSRTTGDGTVERILRALGVAMPSKLQPERTSLHPPRRPDAAVKAVGSAPEDNATRRARSEAEVLAAKTLPKATAHSLAELAEAARALGLSPSPRGIGTDGAAPGGAAPRPESVARARDVHRNPAAIGRRKNGHRQITNDPR